MAYLQCPGFIVQGPKSDDCDSSGLKNRLFPNIYDRSKGCPKYWTVLRFILELLTLKAKHSWSDGSFNGLLRILVWLLPKLNKVPANTYKAKKFVSSFTMGAERIHACPNYYILYRGDTFCNTRFIKKI